MRRSVEAMFDYLDRVDRESNIGPDAARLRSGLGLAKYRFAPGSYPTAALSCGARVKFVFPGAETAAAVVSTAREKATANDPEGCRRKGLCFPHRVRQEFRICDQDMVVTRNAAPYGRNHGVVRSAEHEPQSLCFEPFRLCVALSVARALGSQSRSSEYEVWVAGEGFNTQWHFHIQFRKQRGPIWDYLDNVQGRTQNSGMLDEFPSRPFCVQQSDQRRLVEALYPRVSRFLPAGQIGNQAEPATVRPAMGLLLSYEESLWRAILVTSWYPPGERLFGKQPGLHEHLGEVILDSQAAVEGIEADPSSAARILEDRLREWCTPREQAGAV